MPDRNDWTTVWRDQPGAPPPALRRRGVSLDLATRGEILTSVGATIFFVAVVGWRLAATGQRIPPVGFAAAIAWAVISLVWFRGRLRRPTPDALARPGLEHYRQELMQRRDHLRNPWIWHGPLVAACLTLIAMPAMRPMTTVAPMLLILAAWTVYGIVNRRRQAAALQKELDELPKE
jgi:hypothetical protein